MTDAARDAAAAREATPRPASAGVVPVSSPATGMAGAMGNAAMSRMVASQPVIARRDTQKDHVAKARAMDANPSASARQQVPPPLSVKMSATSEGQSFEISPTAKTAKMDKLSWEKKALEGEKEIFDRQGTFGAVPVVWRFGAKGNLAAQYALEPPTFGVKHAGEEGKDEALEVSFKGNLGTASLKASGTFFGGLGAGVPYLAIVGQVNGTASIAASGAVDVEYTAKTSRAAGGDWSAWQYSVSVKAPMTGDVTVGATASLNWTAGTKDGSFGEFDIWKYKAATVEWTIDPTKSKLEDPKFTLLGEPVWEGGKVDPIEVARARIAAKIAEAQAIHLEEQGVGPFNSLAQPQTDPFDSPMTPSSGTSEGGPRQSNAGDEPLDDRTAAAVASNGRRPPASDPAPPPRRAASTEQVIEEALAEAAGKRREEAVPDDGRLPGPRRPTSSEQALRDAADDAIAQGWPATGPGQGVPMKPAGPLTSE